MKKTHFRIKLKAYYNHTQGVLSTLLYAVIYGAFLNIYMKYKDNDNFPKGFVFAGILISGFMLLRGIKKLLQKKYKEFFRKIDEKVNRLKNLLNKMARKITSKLGLKRLRVFLKGKDKYEFVFTEIRKKNKQEKEKRRKQRLPKWAELTNNKQRVRYIYMVFLMRQSKHGYKIEPAMTPTDIAKVYAKTEGQQRLFECYNEIRYEDENKPVAGSIIKELLPIIKKEK